jgi:hypothetical protein
MGSFVVVQQSSVGPTQWGRGEQHHVNLPTARITLPVRTNQLPKESERMTSLLYTYEGKIRNARLSKHGTGSEPENRGPASPGQSPVMAP